MTYVIIEASGRQICMKPGQFYDVNYMNAEPGDIVKFNRILLLNCNGNIELGNPCLSPLKVKAKVLKHLKGKKITVFKMKAKKNTRVKKGHRQHLTRILVQEIIRAN
uniref:50S ribosomal protein L21, chloroplastic n=1 Tax=Rhodymenia pseudopalmata TaxID=31502 RepID=A0A1C9C7P0_RHOPU|nr:ribosomal protein L21 [Rhodymenia pseudopalmata]AOM64394.1 ribosomal protein L21 [Rhodymenia pseudopalmata]